MYEYELEAELEGELENEFEWEGEWEGEFEGELEAEYEGEEFFRSLVGLARRGLQSPLLRRAGAVARGGGAESAGRSGDCGGRRPPPETVA